MVAHPLCDGNDPGSARRPVRQIKKTRLVFVDPQLSDTALEIETWPR